MFFESNYFNIGDGNNNNTYFWNPCLCLYLNSYLYLYQFYYRSYYFFTTGNWEEPSWLCHSVLCALNYSHVTLFIKKKIYVVYILNNIFRYNSPATQFTHFKCTIQWLVAYSQDCINITLKRNPNPVAVTPSSFYPKYFILPESWNMRTFASGYFHLAYYFQGSSML